MVCQAANNQRFWNCHQILKHNGFDPVGMKDSERTSLLNSILEDNRAQFGHERQEELSASKNPMLTKYLYIEDCGIERSSGTVTTVGTSSSSDMKDKEVKDALSTSVNLSIVKSENPAFDVFKQQLSVMQSAKSTLERLVNSANDLYFQLKASSDPTCTGKSVDVKKVLDAMTKHLDDGRKCLAEYKTVDASTDDLAEKMKHIESFNDLTMAHQDGSKVLKKRCLAIMQ